MSGFKVAVAGATGNVGREMLTILAERRFPASEVVALASPASIGREVSFGERTLKCRALEHYDFSDADLCLMSAGGTVSKEYSPRIGAKGCSKKNIIANPNCSTAQLVVALKPLHDRATIKRVVVATYQSVSGAGKEAMNELWTQTKGKYTMDEPEIKKFPK